MKINGKGMKKKWQGNDEEEKKKKWQWNKTKRRENERKWQGNEKEMTREREKINVKWNETQHCGSEIKETLSELPKRSGEQPKL